MKPPRDFSTEEVVEGFVIKIFAKIKALFMSSPFLLCQKH